MDDFEYCFVTWPYIVYRACLVLLPTYTEGSQNLMACFLLNVFAELETNLVVNAR